MHLLYVPGTALRRALKFPPPPPSSPPPPTEYRMGRGCPEKSPPRSFEKGPLVSGGQEGAEGPEKDPPRPGGPERAPSTPEAPTPPLR
jgi:hypothetical protein